jgi:hypothetical protein
MHGLASLGIPAHPGLAVFHLKRPESNQLHFSLRANAIGDRTQDSSDGIFGSALGGVLAQGPLDGFDQFSFIHSTNSFGASEIFCKAKTCCSYSLKYRELESIPPSDHLGPWEENPNKTRV